MSLIMGVGFDDLYADPRTNLKTRAGGEEGTSNWNGYGQLWGCAAITHARPTNGCSTNRKQMGKGGRARGVWGHSPGDTQKIGGTKSEGLLAQKGKGDEGSVYLGRKTAIQGSLTKERGHKRGLAGLDGWTIAPRGGGEREDFSREKAEGHLSQQKKSGRPKNGLRTRKDVKKHGHREVCNAKD